MIFKDGIAAVAGVQPERMVGIGVATASTAVATLALGGNQFTVVCSVHSGISAVEFDEIISVSTACTVYKSAYLPK